MAGVHTRHGRPRLHGTQVLSAATYIRVDWISVIGIIVRILDTDTQPRMHAITSTAEVGATLAARRKHLELTQQVVASHVGLSQNRLSVLESRPETLTVEQLIALLNVLGLEMHIGAKTGTDL